MKRDVDRRTRSRLNAEEQLRDVFARRVTENIASFFKSIDFDPERLPPQRVIDQEFWSYAKDAYLVKSPHRLSGQPAAGDVELNPLGAPSRESERMRRNALDLIERAYSAGRAFREGETVAIPLYSNVDTKRPWGAAYIRVDVPSLDQAPESLSLGFVAVAILLPTLIAVCLTIALLHFLALRPLQNISAGAVRVTEGRLDEPVPASGHDDEIDALVRTFNAMMNEIQQARSALEERVEQALLQSRTAEKRLLLSERLAAMGTLAAGIAHEINNPVGGMLNAVRSLRRKHVNDPDAERYLGLVEDGLTRVRDVVARVLRFSPARRPSGPVHLAGVIADATRFVQHRLNERGIELSVSVGRDLVTVGDAAALGQVFLNLISNAIDALERAPRPPGAIRVEAERANGSIAITVNDNGKGMDESQRARCFDLFFTTKEAGAGTGLGLAIVHQIVTEHGGTITVESAPELGTTFRLQLKSAEG